MRVRTKLATGRMKRHDDSARVANTSIVIVDCVIVRCFDLKPHLMFLFAAMLVRNVSINLKDALFSFLYDSV